MSSTSGRVRAGSVQFDTAAVSATSRLTNRKNQDRCVARILFAPFCGQREECHLRRVAETRVHLCYAKVAQAERDSGSLLPITARSSITSRRKRKSFAGRPPVSFNI